jgi:ethanolamine ammonia-lyase small subunit
MNDVEYARQNLKNIEVRLARNPDSLGEIKAYTQARIALTRAAHEAGIPLDPTGATLP